MRRQAHRRGSWELPLPQRAQVAPASGRGRPQAFLVAARTRNPAPPEDGTAAFLRMRVLLLAPGVTPAPTEDEPVIGPLPDVPSALAPEHVIQGEILRDLAGRLFERLGEEMRPIERLAIGPRGQLLNLAGAVTETAAPPGADKDTASFRALLPEPGVQRIVNWSEFSELLRPLLAAPSRLCAGHRLACLVQVYRSLKRQTLTELTSAVPGPDGKKQSLHVLIPALAARLGLMELLAKEPPVRAASAEQLAAGSCVVRFRLLNDPTADSAAPLPAPATRGPGRGVQAIPERYLKPWEFRFSREEVLYEMNVRQRFAGPLARFFHGLAACFRGWGDYRRWQILLQDRTAEEQLWAVRPPRGSLTSPPVRAWAKQTLSLAGCDAETMLPEWEIFWRRKGI